MTLPTKLTTSIACLVLCLLSIGCGTVVNPGEDILLVQPSGEVELKKDGAYFAWGRTKVFSIDQKMKSFPHEKIEVFCKDKVNFTISFKNMMSLDPDSPANLKYIKDKVPGIQGEDGVKRLSLTKFYEMGLGDLAVQTVKSIVRVNSSDDIPNMEKQLLDEINTTYSELCKARGFPIQLSGIVFTNLDPDPTIYAKRKQIKDAELDDELKAAQAAAALAELGRDAEKAAEESKAKLIRAQAEADENRILASALTPEFLMWRQYEVMDSMAKATANSKNNTVFMMPYGMMNPETMNATMIKQSVDGLQNAALAESNPN